MNAIKLSIAVICYNHEKYIQQALNSILKQKVNFTYEVIVGDDCSTDQTVQVILEYAARYPNIIQPVIRKENIGMFQNIFDILCRCRGEYIAILEGDDYWTSEEKLRQQVYFLEAHPEFVAITHQCMMIDGEGKVKQQKVPWFSKKPVYSIQEFEKNKLPGPTSGIVSRNILKYKDMDYRFLQNYKNCPGDRILPLLIMYYGKIYCLPDIMSAYRYVLDDSSSSWSAKNDLSKTHNYIQVFRMLEELEEIGKIVGTPVCMKHIKNYYIATSWLRYLRKRDKKSRNMAIEMFHQIEKPCISALESMIVFCHMVGSGLVHKIKKVRK